ncbi:MAG: hypothetical protein ACLTTP_05270 [Alistipes ihumii]
MAKIENPKNYSGRDLETIFFRPMLSGPDARALGIKVMYNTPVPTTLQFWKRAGDILQKYTAAGWKGGDAATKYSKQIALSKVKAEAGYSAEDYFNMVYELITGRPDVNLDDLTGTELEAAETALFKEAIAESIRATMWLGDTEREGALSTFDGFLKRLLADTGDTENDVRCTGFDPAGETAEKLLKRLWDEAPDVLRAFKPQGELVYLVTSDIHARYEEELDGVVLEAAYLPTERTRGPVVPGHSGDRHSGGSYLGPVPSFRSRSLAHGPAQPALAVNTADFQYGSAWYNPDQMENRQRAVFMAGCDYLLPGSSRWLQAASIRNSSRSRSARPAGRSASGFRAIRSSGR